jgi:hypothetical protein
MLSEIRDLFKDLCFSTVIRSSVKVRDAARRGVPVVRFAPSSNAAHDYGSLAFEIQALTARHEIIPPPQPRTGFEPAPHWSSTEDPVAASDVQVAPDGAPDAPAPSGPAAGRSSVIPIR